MAGLTGVANAAASRNTMNSDNMKEVFVSDGTTIAFSVLSTGEDDNIDHVFRHYVEGAGGPRGGRYVHCRSALAELPCWVCDDGNTKKPQMMFAFWALVHTIRTENKPKNTDNWTEKTQRSRTFWEMTVNEPRIISLPNGRQDVYLNTFIDIYHMGNGGDGGFDRVINLSRKGAGRDDTTYNMIPTTVDVKASELPDFTSMDSLRSYFLAKVDAEDAFYGVGAKTATTSIDDDSDDNDLPF